MVESQGDLAQFVPTPSIFIAPANANVAVHRAKLDKGLRWGL